MYGSALYQPYFAVIERALQVIHGRTDVQEAAEHLPVAIGQRRVLRDAVQREIHLRGHALELHPAAGVLHEVIRQLAGVDQLEERPSRDRGR